VCLEFRVVLYRDSSVLYSQRPNIIFTKIINYKLYFPFKLILLQCFKLKVNNVKPFYKGTPKSKMTLNKNHHYYEV